MHQQYKSQFCPNLSIDSPQAHQNINSTPQRTKGQNVKIHGESKITHTPTHHKHACTHHTRARTKVVTMELHETDIKLSEGTMKQDVEPNNKHTHPKTVGVLL